MHENVHEPSDPIDVPPNPRRIDVPGIGSRPVAPLGRRVVARIVDFFVLFPFQLVLVAVAVSYFGLGGNWLTQLNQAASSSGALTVEQFLPPVDVANQFWIVSMLWMSTSGMIAEVWATSVYGGTPGKLITGLRVVSTLDGGRISMNESFNRWALAMFPRMIRVPLLEIVGWLVWASAAFDQTQFRGWHDKVANSVVVDWRKA